MASIDLAADFRAALRRFVAEAGARQIHSKVIGRNLYFHASQVVALLPAGLLSLLPEVIPPTMDDVLIRVDRSGESTSILHYPDFMSHAHPRLCCSARIDVARGQAIQRQHGRSGNYPILHRKELLVRPEHPSQETFRNLTRREEALGLLKASKRIGWSRFWEELLRSRGLAIEGHTIREL